MLSRDDEKRQSGCRRSPGAADEVQNAGRLVSLALIIYSESQKVGTWV